MKASLEILSGIIRIGPDTIKYGDPYELAVAISSIDGKSVTIKGLVSDGKLSFSHYKALLKELKKYNLSPTWVRHKQ